MEANYSDRTVELSGELATKRCPFPAFDFGNTCLHCKLDKLLELGKSMIDKLTEAFAFKQGALNLRHERQQVLAANVANADTPHYKARDFDFSAELARVTESGRSGRAGLSLTTTSDRHFAAKTGGGSAVHELLYRVPEQPSLDGNTVDMERERARFADNSVRYQASLSFMGSYIQGLKSAMQPE